MSEQGVPIEEATAKDFMMVRAKLVKRLGGANEALVWTRIDYRASSAQEAHRGDDGTHWWAATYPEIAEETGLTPEQARRAVEKLIDGGFLRAEQHHGFARTRSYAPIFSHLADSPDGEIARSKRRDRQMDLADSPNAPSIETSKTEKARKRASRIPDQFFVTPEMRAWAAQETPGVDVDEHTREFVDYWRAASGANASKLDWVATWRNWMRKAQRWQGPRDSSAPSSEKFAPGDEWMAFNR